MACLEIAANNVSSRTASLANAHAVLAMFCAENAVIVRMAEAEIAASNGACAMPSVA